MPISVLNSQTHSEIKTINIPEPLQSYAEKNPSSISKVNFVNKKISFTKTSNTKGISDVSGTTRKPFKQKGTGNARQGSLRSPQYKGGGIIFGPKPITANYKINKKEKIHAKKVLLSKIISSNCITTVNSIPNLPYKTKEAKSFIESFKINGKVSIIHNDEIAYETLKSFSNIPNIGIYPLSSFHFHEIIKYDHIIFTEEAINKFFETL